MDSAHSDYVAAALGWTRARDVLAGEDAVKAAGERYLPRLDSQSEEEYAAYKTRASFFGATARTLEEHLELVFRRAPVLSLCSSVRLVEFAGDCDLWGLDFLRHARRVAGEVLGVGRAGSLVLWDAGGRPVVSLWRAEQILNWAVEQVAGRTVLSRVVLRDGERIRVLRVEAGGCVAEVWHQSGQDWILQERVELKRDGGAVPFIPFVFHGPKSSRPEPEQFPAMRRVNSFV